MSSAEWQQRVSGNQMVSAIGAVVLLLGPGVLLVAFPSNSFVTAIFGGYRLFLFYGAVFAVAAWIERPAIKAAFGQSPRENKNDAR